MMMTWMLVLGLVAVQEPETAVLIVQCGEGLKGYSVDSKAGTTAERFSLPTPKFSPTYLRATPDRRFLLAAGDNQVRVFALGADGTPTAGASAASPGGPCYVDVDPSGRRVATANYGSGTTLLFPLGEDGVLGASRSHASGGQSHSVRFHPSGRWVYTCSVAEKRITGFPVDGGKEEGVPLSLPGLGPRHVAFSADGRFAFVVHERPIRVSTLRVDVASGALESVGDWPALPPGTAEKPGFAAAEIAVAPSGRFVYASVRDFSKDPSGNGLNGLAVFAVDANSGRLTWVDFADSGGVSPRGFVIDPAGTRLHVANEIPGTLVTFRADAMTGKLVREGDPLKIGGRSIGIALVPIGRK